MDGGPGHRGQRTPLDTPLIGLGLPGFGWYFYPPLKGAALPAWLLQIFQFPAPRARPSDGLGSQLRGGTVSQTRTLSLHWA